MPATLCNGGAALKSERDLKRLSDPGLGILLFFLLVFALITLYLKQTYLAAAELTVFVILLVYTIFARRARSRLLSASMEAIAYETEDAKSNTLRNFPLPMAVFKLDDTGVVWGNEMFFSMFGVSSKRLDARMAELLPGFSGKWLLEGREQYPSVLEIGGRKYQVHGNLIRSEKAGDNAFTGVTYWVDVTESEEIRRRYQDSRPVPGIVIIDNLDELGRNQTDRVRNELRDAVEDRLRQWCDSYNGILRRYDRDRFIAVFEKKDLDRMKQSRFPVIEQIHQVESPNGIVASISIGFGEDADAMGEGLQFADKAVELALSRGGDQVVVKNRLSFEFFGGRGLEVEKRTKVKSRVMANTLAELMRDSSQVLVMGHRFADLDAVGAAAGICCLARKCGVRARIAMDLEHNASHSLIERLQAEPAYKDAFLSPSEALQYADSRTLLVVVDTNRPEQVEDASLLDACNRVAVIDHHRVAATYIHNAALGFIEPYASSACELVTEILQEVTERADMLRCEAEAMLAGIVLDTKSFSIRTGERTFDAAAYLRRAGADTEEVKKLFQAGMEDTVARYKIMQQATLHGKVAVAAPEEPQNRVVAAKAADELLNISGVEASVVVSPDGKGNINVSARSIGEVNVQILMEKLGGGGNRSAAAAQLKDTALEDAVNSVYAAIDDYFG